METLKASFHGSNALIADISLGINSFFKKHFPIEYNNFVATRKTVATVDDDYHDLEKTFADPLNANVTSKEARIANMATEIAKARASALPIAGPSVVVEED